MKVKNTAYQLFLRWCPSQVKNNVFFFDHTTISEYLSTRMDQTQGQAARPNF